MKIIYDMNELEGTCYMEVMPGKYEGKCWNEGSIFFDEEHFGYLEKVIEIENPTYDHFGFQAIPIEVWERILNRFDVVIARLLNDPNRAVINEFICFIFQSTEREFYSDFEQNLQSLIAFIQEFQMWIRKQLKTHAVISVLGI